MDELKQKSADAKHRAEEARKKAAEAHLKLEAAKNKLAETHERIDRLTPRLGPLLFTSCLRDRPSVSDLNLSLILIALRIEALTPRGTTLHSPRVNELLRKHVDELNKFKAEEAKHVVKKEEDGKQGTPKTPKKEEPKKVLTLLA